MSKVLKVDVLYIYSK
jgi:hypothetical protein